jgi:hypothetical protein
MGFFVYIIHDINVCFIALVYMDYLVFSSKAEARRLVAGQVVPAGIGVPPLALSPLSKKEKRGGGASGKSSTRQGPCSAIVRGRGRGSAKIKTNRVLLDVDARASDGLPLIIKQSF